MGSDRRRFVQLMVGALSAPDRFLSIGAAPTPKIKTTPKWGSVYFVFMEVR